MATRTQIILQQGANARYTNGEVVLPLPPSPPVPPKLVIYGGVQEEGADLGVIKVEGGKFVLDMEDFDPDFGIF